MKRICIDCRYINGRPSGIGEMVSALIEHVPRLAPDIYFRFLVSPDARDSLSDNKNVEHVTVNSPANGPGTMWWLPTLTDISDVDLFHATYNIMPAGLHMPCLTTIHDLMWVNQPHWCDDSWKRSFRKIFFSHGINRALKYSDAIATVSKATLQSVVAARPDAKERSFVTQSGVSDIFCPVARDHNALASLGLNPNNKIILTVGQYAPYKNHEAVIQSFAHSCSNRQDVDLVLVQRQGPQANRLLNIAENLGVRDRVYILRDLQLDELIHLYSSSAILLHPSLCEGFGNPLAEAMACGCPIITSDRSAMPEVTAGAALLIDPENIVEIASAINRVLDDASLAASMVSSGYERKAQLSWDSFARANLKLYRHLLDGN